MLDDTTREIDVTVVDVTDPAEVVTQMSAAVERLRPLAAAAFQPDGATEPAEAATG